MNKTLSTANVPLKNPDIACRVIKNRLYILFSDNFKVDNRKLFDYNKESLVFGDETSGEIWELIDGKMTINEIIETLKAKYIIHDEKKIAEDVMSFFADAGRYNLVLFKE